MNKMNLIVVEVISKNVAAKMKQFMNQMNDLIDILNFFVSYEQEFVLDDVFIIANFDSSFSFDRYIIIIEKSKSNNDVFNDDARYEQLLLKSTNNDDDDDDEKNENDDDDEKNDEK